MSPPQGLDTSHENPLPVAGARTRVRAARGGPGGSRHDCRSFRSMKLCRRLLCLLALTAAFLAGCRSTPGTSEPLDTTKYTIESTDKFVPLDEGIQAAITCTGLQERILPDGRLEVVANVKNRSAQRLRVQINCVFKDEQGGSIGDQTPFRSLTLTENTTEAVTFDSSNNLARRYTIQVQAKR